MAEPTIYEALARPFENTQTDVRGGVTITYITGEQCVSRLNEVLGVAGWCFRVVEHGYHQESDEFWSLGEISALIDGQAVVRQQFGSQKVKRSRATDSPLDIGFDLKGATTDALKKCASLLGVALYLSHKETPAESEQATPQPSRSAGQPSAPTGTLVCAECNAALKEVRFRDGTVWAPAQLASYGRRKHGRVLCMDHYREANAARKRAEARASAPSNDINSIPF